MLGIDREVSIPAGCSVRCREDVDVHGNNSSDSGTVASSSWLVLKLRQVNGDGVMSGVSTKGGCNQSTYGVYICARARLWF